MYAQPPPQPVGLCRGCGTKPRYVEKNGRVHDYCGKTCRDSYHYAQMNPVNVNPLPSGYPCARGGCTSRTLTQGGYCAAHRPSQNTRLNVQTNYKRKSYGPMSAQPQPTPRAPPLRKYSVSSPYPGSSWRNPKSILFYNKNEPYYEFTNFSDHPINYNGHYYKTSEHLFQSLKFLDTKPHIAMQIRRVNTAREAFNIAQANKQYQRPDWLQVNIAMMDLTLLHKFRQHRNLKDMLLATGDAELIENSPLDSFWGNGADKLGRNELGKALMRLRGKFQRGEA
ncbi:hypothetical protein C0995_007575 [Termitomyces sp. Mi166|nr:hypothetical protein C0995_007575 [Termitomyces sp. Mi166\